MKRIPTILRALLASLFLGSSAYGQLPLPWYEAFPANYTNGGTAIAVPQGGSTFSALNLAAASTPSAVLWTIGGSPGGGSSQVVGGPAAQTYPILATNPVASVGLYIRTNLPTANRGRGVLLSTVTSGSVYTSFLLNLEQAPNGTAGYTNRVFALLTSLASGTPAAASTALGIGVDSASNLTLAKSSITTSIATNSTALTPGTHLIVARYTFNPDAGDDEVALWLDPGSLAAPSAPTPNIIASNATDQAGISSFYILHPQSGAAAVPVSLFVDEIRVGTSWADVTPTGTVCTAASVITSPTNQTLVEGLAANISVVPGGTTPNIQWQLSTNSGSTWNGISGATNQTYTTPILAAADSGHQYRSIVTVPCNNSSATSAVATLTVSAAVVTPLGLVMDDFFDDGSRINTPYDTNNSVWLTTTTGGVTLDASSGDLFGTPGTSSALWLGFFTDDLTSPPGLPVHLAVGNAIRVTLPFTPNNVVSNGGNSLRIGLFDYADGGTRPTADGSTVSGSGANVRGYMLVMNFGTNFGSDEPMTLHARNSISSTDLMGTTGVYASLGNGPAGATLLNTPAFMSGTTYTLQFTVHRTAFSTVQVTTSITGGGSNWTHTVADSTYAYPRFDALGFRANTLATTADNFTFPEFKVEVVAAAIPVAPFSITEVQLLSPTSLKLTWDSVSGKSYQIQSTPALNPTSWSTNATVTASGTATSYTNSPLSGGQRFYRVVATP
jgi:large repetitive protein